MIAKPMVELGNALSSFEIPAKLIRLVRRAETNITCDGILSGLFATTEGLPHGDGLVCVLFNLALERTIRGAKVETSGTIFDKSMPDPGIR